MNFKNFFNKYKKLHLWLLTDLVLMAFFLLTRNNRAWMNALTTHVTEPLKRAIASVTYLVEFSVAEMLYVTAILVGVVWLADTVKRLACEEWQRLYPRLLGLACAALTI